MIKSRDFSEEEYGTILRKGIELIQHGYFTGVNFIQSSNPLPKESIVIHYLHDSQRHIDYLRPKLFGSSSVVPRFTYYAFDTKYFDKLEFDKKYINALFFDENFNRISIKNAKIKRKNIFIGNLELDLLLQLNTVSLEDIVKNIISSNKLDLERWIDPVIIIRTKTTLPTLSGFVNSKYFVGLGRTNEEFYTILTDEIRARALMTYLNRLCKSNLKIGELNEKSIVFEVSQINEVFYNYMLDNIKKLRFLE